MLLSLEERKQVRTAVKLTFNSTTTAFLFHESRILSNCPKPVPSPNGEVRAFEEKLQRSERGFLGFGSGAESSAFGDKEQFVYPVIEHRNEAKTQKDRPLFQPTERLQFFENAL